MPQRPARIVVSTLVGGLVAVSLMAACTPDDPEPTPDPTMSETTAVATTDPAPTESEEVTAPAATESAPADEDTAEGPAFSASVEDQSGDVVGSGLLVFTDLRVGAHDGFDRIVMEFAGSGTAGWYLRYAEPPLLTEGAGDTISIAGSHFLQIGAIGTTWPSDSYYDGPDQFEPTSTDFAEVFVEGTFEGWTTMYVGLEAQTPFRVFTLTEPSRLVIDVLTDDSAG